MPDANRDAGNWPRIGEGIFLQGKETQRARVIDLEMKLPRSEEEAGYGDAIQGRQPPPEGYGFDITGLFAAEDDDAFVSKFSLLTPFYREMRRKGYQLTRCADDWVITCASAVEAHAALEAAGRVLKELA